MGHPVLRAKARPVPPAEITTPRIQQLIDDMFETMREYSGIGLAAPQVHEGVRLFVAGIRPPDAAPTDLRRRRRHAAHRRRSTRRSRRSARQSSRAGRAVSAFPTCAAWCRARSRSAWTGYDRRGKKISLTAHGLPARVIQHETDHLDGVLFFDRMRSLETLTFMDEYQRYWTKDEDE